MRFRIFIIGFMISLGLQACKEPYAWHGNDISGGMPDLQFALVGPDENKVTAESLQGKPVLIFFGFTHCPDVCPTTLTQLKMVIKKLGPDADQVQVLLVSVDPGRDTPAVMKAYTAGFGPWLLGLTGPQDDIDSLLHRYKVYASMGSADGRDGYNVMHSSVVFVFDGQGQARLVITDLADSDAVVSDIRQLINQ